MPTKTPSNLPEPQPQALEMIEFICKKCRKTLKAKWLPAEIVDAFVDAGRQKLLSLPAEEIQQFYLDAISAHGRKIVTFLERRQWSSQDALDISQESVLRMLKAVRTGPVPKKLKPWFWQTVRNTAKNERRRQGRHPVKELAPDQEPTRLDPALSVSEGGADSSTWAAFKQALKPEQAQVLELREEGRKAKEIAKMLELSVHDVKAITKATNRVATRLGLRPPAKPRHRKAH